MKSSEAPPTPKAMNFTPILTPSGFNVRKRTISSVLFLTTELREHTTEFMISFSVGKTITTGGWFGASVNIPGHGLALMASVKTLLYTVSSLPLTLMPLSVDSEMPLAIWSPLTDLTNEIPMSIGWVIFCSRAKVPTVFLPRKPRHPYSNRTPPPQACFLEVLKLFVSSLEIVAWKVGDGARSL